MILTTNLGARISSVSPEPQGHHPLDAEERKIDGESSMYYKCLLQGRNVNSADSLFGYHPECSRLFVIQSVNYF